MLNPMSNMKESESTDVYEAGFIVLMCRLERRACPTPPIAALLVNIWSDKSPNPNLVYGELVLDWAKAYTDAIAKIELIIIFLFDIIIQYSV